MALLRSAVLSLLAILVYASSTAGNHTVSTAECADLSNTTWSEYRHGGKLEVQYLLLTRSNMDCATVFSKESLSDPQRRSPFNSSLPSKVIIHGFRALGTKPSWVKTLAQGLLWAEDVNVLVVDWVYGASFAYNRVVQNYKEVAVQISVLINELITHGSKLESFHFIGVSLGAHVSGFVGTLFGGKIGRITGLDPAGPMFKGADVYDRLDPSDALFVEAIHTDSDYFGISIPVGHVDFFLNGGMDQAGCARSQFASMYGYFICDHMRAVHVYISALNDSCPLTGFPCYSYDQFLNGRCVDCQETFEGTCPRIGLLERSGITVSPLPYQEKVFLLTSASAPFCVHHILVELEVSPLEKSAEVQVTLSSGGHPEMERKLKMHTKENVYKTVMASPVPLCKIHSIQLKNTGSRFYRQGDIRFQSVCISELPRKRETDAVCVNTVYLGRSFPWSHDFVLLCGSY
ncbi:phospholipase A1 member A isoform X2 [Megalops cyprinoides]|uniref:phospholipase A1 member A isoform X2 n=1 Tax=Megalops cyprinoides TaxID=118141 RepID=UPI001863E519|nr:phospholipase A1 member A isoform X2 [Megalops cyprinoides]